MNPLTKFLALSTATIIIMSLTLTGMFYYAHASEFPSTTITNTTSSSESVHTVDGKCPTYYLNGVCQTVTAITTTAQNSRTTSDYGQLGIILTIALVAVLVIIAVLRRRVKNK